ncbi:MAG TPA: hypothetical protein DCS79_05360 [Gammaproteobacteria bacterium]|nr:hypothetical protein [Gammaproteobacteria bacterium]
MSSDVKILAVDDDPLILSFIKATLGSQYNLMTTQSPNQAFELIIRFRPDLLITDIVMDELDGLALSSLVRVARGSHEIPIIVLSSHDNSEIQREIGVNKVNRYLRKPCKPSDLLAAVSELCSK